MVVVDAEGRFATRRSPAFLDHRNAAFEVVENALHALAMRARATDGAEFQTDSRTARDGAARGADDCTNDEKKRIARFATNACGETAADLDDETGFAFAKLPTVEHPDMDSEHADIERLMRLALDTRAARDVRNLTEVFRKHAAAEEAPGCGFPLDLRRLASSVGLLNPIAEHRTKLAAVLELFPPCHAKAAPQHYTC